MNNFNKSINVGIRNSKEMLKLRAKKFLNRFDLRNFDY